MALAKVLSFIHHHMMNTRTNLENDLLNLSEPQQYKKISDGNGFIRLLSQIRNLIEESNSGSDLEKIARAIRLIEQVPLVGEDDEVSYFWSILKEHRLPVFKNFSDKEHLQSLTAAEYEMILGSLHVTLMRYYQFASQLKPIWNTSTISDPDILKDPAVLEWQHEQQEITASSNAFWCFRRGLTFGDEFLILKPHIQPMNAKELTDEQLNAMLRRFVNLASAYSNKEKELIFQWFKCGGGQDNSRFLDKLLSDSYFTEASFTPGISKSVEQHWFITKEGKICFNYDVLYMSLQQGSSLTLFMAIPKKGEHIPAQYKTGDLGQYATDLEALISIPPKERKPVMRANANLVLSVSGEEKVIPNISYLQVNAFTELLAQNKHTLRAVH